MMEQTLCEQIKRRVMARVYAIYVLRQTTSPVCLRTLALGAILALGLIWFSWDKVFLNMFSAVDGIIPFFSYSWLAFLNTELPVQIITITSSGIILWLVWDVLPAVKTLTKTVVYKPLRFFGQKVL